MYLIIKIYSHNYKKMKYKNIINVAYAFDKNYHYITHVSMKTIMLNQNKDTFINFYILVSNLKKEQEIVINKISEEHENCKIQFFDMKDDFKELHLPIKIWSTANFYRLRLPDLLKDVKKIIYLDTDTLIYKDLSKLYNYNIEGKYFIGMLEFKGKKFIKRYKINRIYNLYYNIILKLNDKTLIILLIQVLCYAIWKKSKKGISLIKSLIILKKIIII